MYVHNMMHIENASDVCSPIMFYDCFLLKIAHTLGFQVNDVNVTANVLYTHVVCRKLINHHRRKSLSLSHFEMCNSVQLHCPRRAHMCVTVARFALRILRWPVAHFRTSLLQFGVFIYILV